MSHWLLEEQEEIRQQALNLAQRAQNSHKPTDEKLIQRAADMLEMAVLDLVLEDIADDEKKQRELQLAAADAFCLLHALPRPNDALDAGKFLLRAGILAVLGDKEADAVRWLDKEPWNELPVDSEDWHKRTWATVLDVWLRLIRQHYTDLGAVLKRISRLRDAQPDFEKKYLVGQEMAHPKVVALELIGLYHLVKAAEILVHAIDGKLPNTSRSQYSFSPGTSCLRTCADDRFGNTRSSACRPAPRRWRKNICQTKLCLYPVKSSS